MSDRKPTGTNPPLQDLVANQRLTSSGAAETSLSDLASQLMSLAQDLMQMAGGTQNHFVPSAASRPNNAEQARAIYRVRRSRSSIFDTPEIFGEPAWDILLDLYIATAEGKDISVSSACIGSAVPPTTGLRWLGILADKGLIVRRHDPLDQRRILVHLTREGLEMMDRFFEAVEAQSGPRP